MSAFVFAQHRGSRTRAEKALAKLPESVTKHGVAVPFPYADREEYKAGHTNREINKAIQRAPVVSVPLRGIYSIQHSVKSDRVKQYLEEPHLRPPAELHPKAHTPVDFPIVIQCGGKRFLHDGNHRCAAAWLSGDKQVNARLVKLDDVPWARGAPGFPNPAGFGRA